MINKVINRCRRWKRQADKRKLIARISGILDDSTPPDTAESENAFGLLQSAYPATRGDLYKYDDFSLFERASQRALQVLKMPGFSEPGKTILEIGAGDGVLGAILASYGHQVVLTDVDDWRSRMAQALDLRVADISKGLPLDDSMFDLVVSYNSFEHFPDPPKAFAEAQRVTKPKGFLHFSFGPLYCSPWGMHAYRSFHMPYSQFLFSDDFINNKLKEIGIIDLGVRRTELQYMNRWKWSDFDALWRRSSCSVCSVGGYEDEEHLGLVFQFPEAFRGRGLQPKDLTRSTISVTLQKRNV